MKNIINLFISLLIFLNGFANTKHLQKIMLGVEAAQSIYNDFSIITDKGTNINDSLTDIEVDNRYYLLFNNYLNKYSMKNRNIVDMNGRDYDLFRDMYKEVEEGLVKYLFKNKGDLKKEWSYYPSKVDCIIDKVHQALFVLERKKEYRKNVSLILNFKNNLDSLFLDYAQEEKNLQNVLNDFIQLEEQSSGLTNLEKELFQNFLDGKKMAEKETIQVFSFILQGVSIIDYKSIQYIEKKNLIDKIINKIDKLISEIDILIKKQNDLLRNTDMVYKQVKNLFSAEAGKNQSIKKVLENMNFVIEHGKVKKIPRNKYALFLKN